MNTARTPGHARLRPTLLALALCAAFAPARAADDENDLDETVLSIGLGATDGDVAQFGPYSGLREGRRAIVALDGELYRFDAASLRSLHVVANGLAGDNRSLGLTWRQQGDWRIGATFSQLTWRDPRVVRSGVEGIGGDALHSVVVAPGSGAQTGLALERTELGLQARTALGRLGSLDVALKTENKTGTRLFGIGMTCPSVLAPQCRGASGVNLGSAVMLAPEPVDANHTQLDARVSYGEGPWFVSAGLYGSVFRNRLDRLTLAVPDQGYNALGMLLPIRPDLHALLAAPVALAPDNEAFQVDVSGGYALSPTTQLRAKLAHGRSTQRQDFAAAGFAFAPAGVSSLQGRLDHTLVQFGLSAQPIEKLALQADLRWEDRDDRTPLAYYDVRGDARVTNRQQPLTKTNARVSLAYPLAPRLRGTLSAEYEAIDRGVFTPSAAVAGLSALRQKTDETTLRAELRRSLDESLAGSIALETSRRGGSNWLRNVSGAGVAEVTDPFAAASGLGADALYMPTLADRQRDKLRVRSEWQPNEAFSLQVQAEAGRDAYTMPGHGVHHADMGQIAFDAGYAFSERWRLDAQAAWSTQTLAMSRPGAAFIDMRNTDKSLTLGVSGKPIAKTEFGASLTHALDRSVTAQTLDDTAHPDQVALLAATGGLPDIVYRQTTLKLFGRYEIDKQSAVRVDLLHQRTHNTDWAWGTAGVPYVYADGSTVWQQPQSVGSVLVVRYTYRWK